MTIVKFYPNNAAENPDHVLEQAVGEYDQVLILGFDKEGSFCVRADLSVSDERAIWFMEHFKHKLFAGDYDDEV